MTRFPITKNGSIKIAEELRHLKQVERPAIIKAIASARELGDLSENAEYHSAKEKQGFIEGKIRHLEDKLARAEIIDISILGGTRVKFGATITLMNLDTNEDSQYIIAGEYEADMTKKIISIRSPIARAMIGKEIGDVVEVITPRGIKTYEIMTMKFVEFSV